MAKLILEFLQTLIWPVTLLILVHGFRRQISSLFERLSQGKEFEVEIAGQKLKVHLMEKGLEDISNRAKVIEQAASSEIKAAGEELLHDIEILSVATNLSPLETRFLAKFYAAEVWFLKQLSPKYEGVPETMISRGLLTLERESGALRLTEVGNKILNWIVSQEK